MLIKNFRITNYKSFLDSRVCELESGFNIVVGANNAGKTTVLEALGLRFFENKPHLNIEILSDTHNSSTSLSTILFQLKLGEVKKLLPNELLPNFDSEIEIEVQFFGGGEIGKVFTKNLGFSQEVLLKIAKELKKQIYTFRAERLHVGQCDRNEQPNELLPDAANLPAVLYALQEEDPEKFADFIELFGCVFPQITKIFVRNPEGTLVKIYLLANSDPQREDLAVAMQDSGTGLGQVLAILYVVFTSQNPRTIIIDEPQSFLHPDAIRKLLDLLQKKYSQHQYVISTHSPVVITIANPKLVLKLQKNNRETKIDPIGILERKDVLELLKVVGARLSDVFGTENVLWVEGQTEEAIYPLILKNENLAGKVILCLYATGDLDGNVSITDRRKIAAIYKKLTTGPAKGLLLLPSSIAFLLDREKLTPKEIEDKFDSIRNADGEKIFHFLPRKMIENYFLNPQAIFQILSEEIETFQIHLESPMTLKGVKDLLNKEMTGKSENFLETKIDLDEQYVKNWLRDVHGASVLGKIFWELSKIKYDKKIYGERFITWLIKNSPEDLKEIEELLFKLLHLPVEGVNNAAH